MKNPLLYLPPELAHRAAILALKSGLLQKSPPDTENLKVSILGHNFSNPLGLSAGADKQAEALKGWQNAGFGFVEAGTLMPRPRPGNPRPRLWRFSEQNAVVNWLGLPSAGPEVFLRNLARYKANPAHTMPVGVSIASTEGLILDFETLSARASPLADYIALNISCPNTPEDLGGTLQTLKAQVKAVTAQAGRCPVLVKLGPSDDRDVLKALVQTALDAGAAGLIATNTVPYEKRALLRHAVSESDFSWPTNAQGIPVGGYSGPALLAVSLFMISEMRMIVGPKVPLIGVGGVQGPMDALRLLKAGANLVQLYTALIYKGLGVVREIKEGLARS